MTQPASEKIPLKTELTIYSLGLFSHTASNMMTIVVPLWALTLDPSPVVMGLILGSRAFLSVALSIHWGSVMDRFDPRKINIVFAILSMILPVFYPMLPWYVPLILLQMVLGLVTSMSWLGSQALIAEVTKGNPTYIGRLTFSNRIALLVGPPLIGLTWDLLGPWGAFAFLGLWSVGTLLAAYSLPTVKRAMQEAVEPFRLRDILPSFSEYADATRLLAIPTIAFVISISFLRQSGSAIHATFYIVYLESVGLSGVLIGVLVAVGHFVGGLGSLSVGPFARRFRNHFFLIVLIVVSTASMAATPLFDTFLPLMILGCVFGAAMGMSNPLMVAMISQTAGLQNQGKAIALRTTANRSVGSIMPIVTGAIVAAVGLSNSFLLIGGVVIPLLLLFGAYLHFSRRFESDTGSPTVKY